MAEKKTAKDNRDAPVELPSAKALMQQIAEKEADKASEYMRQQTAAEAEKKGTDRTSHETVGRIRSGGDQAGNADYSARRRQWSDRGPGPSVSEQALHRQRTRHQ